MMTNKYSKFNMLTKRLIFYSRRVRSGLSGIATIGAVNTFIVLAALVDFPAMAQDDNQMMKLDMAGCIEYALNHATDMQNAILEEQSARSKVKEITGLGLPQVSGSVTLQHSPTLSRFYGEYTPGSSSFISDDVADQVGMESGDVYALENLFQLQNSGDASLSVNQLIFNGSYFVGLKVSKAYKDLAIKQRDKVKGDVISDVAKSYFNVLINKDRLRLFSASLARLDTLYRNTKALYDNGFAEEIEVDRLKVSLNNAQSDYSNLKNLDILSMRILKFQMNYPLDKPLELIGSIEDVLSRPIEEITDEVTYSNRPDYQVLVANRALQELNLRDKYAQTLPVIGAYANLGYNTQSSTFGALFTEESSFTEGNGLGRDSWYGYSAVGLSLSWNIFTGFQKRQQIQQEKIALEQINNSIDQFEYLINIEVKEAGLTFQNAMQKFEVQKENVALADKVFVISKAKYEEGIGSNLEVVDADSGLKEAQTNYYNTLFEVILAKIDLNRAKGEFENE